MQEGIRGDGTLNPPTERLFGALRALRGVLQGVSDDSESLRVPFGAGFDAICDCS